MSTTTDILDRIRKRPALYLGEHSLSALYYASLGYDMALGVHGITTGNFLALPRDFDDWVAYRLHFREPTSGWRRMILQATADEAAAFDRFFELLDDYKARKGKVVAKLVGFEKTFTMRSAGREETLRYPNRILLIAYTQDSGLFAISDEPGHSFPHEGFFPSLQWFEEFTGADRSQLTIVDADTFDRWVRDSESGATEGPSPQG